MRYRGIHSRELWILAIFASALGTSMVASAQPPVPDNMGGGLRQLFEARVNAAAASSAVSAASLLEPRVLRDAQSRVLVNVWLDGKHRSPPFISLLPDWAPTSRPSLPPTARA